MKGLIWVVVLFAVAAGLAVASSLYGGNVYIVVEQTMLRINLHAFILGLLAVVVVLYLLVRLLAGVLHTPGRLQRYGAARKGRKAHNHLNAAGLAFFEGKFQQAEQEAAKVLLNREAGDDRALALMLGAHAADEMDDADMRARYLQDMAQLPAKNQLSRYLLLAESALAKRDYPLARQNITAAAKLNPSLTRLVKLQLRYAFDHGDAVEVLDKTDKLLLAGALNEHEAEQYGEWAYRRLLAQATDASGLKACLKRIPESAKSGELCELIAERYTQLGLYADAVAWVGKYYPANRRSDLLPWLVQSVNYLDDREQRKTIDMVDGWLVQNPKDAALLTNLGQLAYAKQLWGKAQGYLEASLSIRPSVPAYLALAKVFDATGNTVKADEQRLQALQLAQADPNSAVALQEIHPT